MKKVIPILLTFLIFFNSSGYIFIYIERLANNKREMKALIYSKDSLSIIQKLKFTWFDYETKLNWKEEKEFEYKGRMYDVERVEIKSNYVIVYCLRDETEEMLISNFEKGQKSNSTKDKIALGSHASSIAFHLLAIQSETYLSKIKNNVILHSGSYVNYYKSIYKNFPAPPPKLA
jgi:hypothetical protein